MEGSARDYDKVSVSRSHSLSHVLHWIPSSPGSSSFAHQLVPGTSPHCHVCANWGTLIGGGDLHVNFAASSDAKL